MNWNGKVKIVTVNTKERKEGGNGMEAEDLTRWIEKYEKHEQRRKKKRRKNCTEMEEIARGWTIKREDLWTCNGISRRGKKEEEKTEGKEMEEQIEKGRRECFNGEKMGMDDPMKKNEIEH
uniref:Uncharacterized protein n=1 Tax=Pristionchus pacificus TaxID=54126 RepID=A0A2A6BEG5_PRIPA|eukprot:PDM64246.1 hypothetical protein PRIPAC_54490 [Pristionchus pacificus]